MSRLPHFPNEFKSLGLSSSGVFKTQTVVLLISGSSYIRPGAAERAPSVVTVTCLGPDCGYDSDTWSYAVLRQGKH